MKNLALKRLFFIINFLLKDSLSISEIVSELEKNNIFSTPRDIQNDLNKLELVGFDVTKSKRNKNGVHYKILKTPFKFDFTDNDIYLVKNILKESNENPEKLKLFFEKIVLYNGLTFEDFFSKPIDKNNKGYIENRDILKKAVDKQALVKILYKSIISNVEKEHEGFAIKFTRDEKGTERVFLFFPNKDQLLEFNIERIVSKPIVDEYTTNKLKISEKIAVFKLYGQAAKAYHLIKSEEILSETEDYKIIKTNYINNFSIIQRLFKYGELCEILEPLDLRQEIASKIKTLFERY